MVESPGHHQFLVESEDPATENELLPARLLPLWQEKDEGGVADHHPQSGLVTGGDVAGIVTVVVDDHFPGPDGGDSRAWRGWERE